MRALICTCLSAALVFLPGCSLFVGSTQSVTVTSTDPTAELYADGQPIGTGVATVVLKKNESHAFMAKTPDGRAGVAQVGRSLSGTAMLDLVGGFFLLLPFFGLLAPGAWQLDSTAIMIAVPPPPPPRAP